MYQENARARGSGRFPETSWALVVATRTDAGAGNALDALCRRYWAPIYAGIRRQGAAPDDAEDLTQAFFLHLLEHRTLARADPGRGRFRSFLLGALRWFLANSRERDNAAKRHGRQRFISIDAAEVEAALPGDGDSTSLEVQFDRQWARTLVDNALSALGCEYRDKGRSGEWEALQHWLDPQLETPSYASLAARLGGGEGAAKVAVHRVRRRFREALREEVGNTVATAQDVDEELRYLRDVLAAPTLAAPPR